MIINTKLGYLKEIVTALNEVMEEKLPVKTAYALSKLGKNIAKELDAFEDTRLKVVAEYAVKDANGLPVIENGNYKISNEEAFSLEYNELANIDCQIEFEPISLDALGSIQVSPAALLRLEQFITE